MQPRLVKRDTPHPLVTLTGVLIAFALIWVALKTALLQRSTAMIFTIGFVVVFRWASRWSARAMREKRERALEHLRTTPVLGLDD